MFKTFLPLAIVLANTILGNSLLAPETNQAVHLQKIDISKYVYGRRMIVNKCYAVLQDTTTIFSFDPEVLTIETCSKHQCSFILDDHNFKLG
jgi:hypothetical protein